MCNHLGNEKWMEQLEWTGKEGYNEAEMMEWKVEGEKAGYYKTFKNLSVRIVDKVLYYDRMLC